MALTIAQASAVSFPALLKKKVAENQWSDSSAMKALEKFGMIDHRSLGPTIEVTLDYKRNPGGKFLTTEMEAMSLAKTDVISAASYTPAELSIPVTWTKRDEVTNSSENQKIALTKQLVNNGFATHDELIEEALFTTLTAQFTGWATLIPTTGLGSVGGIDASSEVFWRNPNDTYLADGSDIEAVLNDLYATAMRGSGSGKTTKLLVSGSEAMNLFESTQTPFKRYEGESLVAGFKTIAYKTALWVFSQYGDDHIYGLNDSYKLIVSKEYFRDKGETKELEEPNAFGFKIYSALQGVLSNKSRVFVASEAP